MAEYTTDNGRIIRCTVEGYLIGLIKEGMKENGRTTNNIGTI